MKRILFLFLIAGLGFSCQHPGNEENNSNISTQKGKCGDVFELTPANAPSRMPAEDPTYYFAGDVVECACFGENHLRIIYYVYANCCGVEVDGSAKVEDHVITLKSSVKGIGECDCECSYPVCIDITQMEYGEYTIMAGDIEFSINFQPDMTAVREGHIETF